MNSCNTFLRLFAILVVMFANLTISLPGLIPTALPPIPKGILLVTSPDKGPWAIGSGQVISWICVTCKTEDDVKIEIFKTGTKDPVLETTGKNAKAGSKAFELDPEWAVTAFPYFVRVSLQNDPGFFGIGKPFTVFATNLNQLKLPI